MRNQAEVSTSSFHAWFLLLGYIQLMSCEAIDIVRHSGTKRVICPPLVCQQLIVVGKFGLVIAGRDRLLQHQQAGVMVYERTLSSRERLPL
jgi:hypothetical protein